MNFSRGYDPVREKYLKVINTQCPVITVNTFIKKFGTTVKCVRIQTL